MDSDDSPLSLFDEFDFKSLSRRRGSEPLLGLARLSESPSEMGGGVQWPGTNVPLHRRASFAVGMDPGSRSSSTTNSGVDVRLQTISSAKPGRDVSILGRLLTDPMLKNISRRSTCPEINTNEQNQSMTSGTRLPPVAVGSTQISRQSASQNGGISTSSSMITDRLGWNIAGSKRVGGPDGTSVIHTSTSSSLNRGEQFVGTNQEPHASVLGLPQKIKVSKRELNLITPSSF